MAAASLGACSQDSGETCQLDGDCGSGLICCRGAAARGVCDTKAECESGAVTDSGSNMSFDDAGDAASSGEDSAAPMSTDDAGGSGSDAG